MADAEPTTETETPTAVTEAQPPEDDPNRPWSPEELNTELTPEELAAIKQELPLLDEVISWFDEQIKVYSNPETIGGVNISSKPEDVKQAVLFAQTLIKDYKDKRDEFTKKFKHHIGALQG
jgi:hypothetical protein